MHHLTTIIKIEGRDKNVIFRGRSEPLQCQTHAVTVVKGSKHEHHY